MAPWLKTLLLVGVILVTAEGLGLPCMQKDTVEAKVRECFVGTTGDHFDPSDRSGTLGQLTKTFTSAAACSHEEDMINGLVCYYEFTGNCLNMMEIFPNRTQITKAADYACSNVAAFQKPCLTDVPQNMMKCYLRKVMERTMKIMSKDVEAGTMEEEICLYMDKEMECLADALKPCDEATAHVYTTYMKMFLPGMCNKMKKNQEENKKDLYRLLTDRMHRLGYKGLDKDINM